MHAIQIVLICFAGFAISRVLMRYRRGGMAGLNLLLWLVVWSGVIVVAVHPDTTSWVAMKLGVGRGVDIAMYLSILILFYLLFRSFTKLEDLDRQLTRVVRANALREMEEDLAEQSPRKTPSA